MYYIILKYNISLPWFFNHLVFYYYYFLFWKLNIFPPKTFLPWFHDSLIREYMPHHKTIEIWNQVICFKKKKQKGEISCFFMMTDKIKYILLSILYLMMVWYVIVVLGILLNNWYILNNQLILRRWIEDLMDTNRPNKEKKTKRKKYRQRKYWKSIIGIISKLL